MTKEAPEQFRATGEPALFASDGAADVGHVIGSEVRQAAVLEIRPELLGNEPETYWIDL